MEDHVKMTAQTKETSHYMSSLCRGWEKMDDSLTEKSLKSGSSSLTQQGSIRKAKFSVRFQDGETQTGMATTSMTNQTRFQMSSPIATQSSSATLSDDTNSSNFVVEIGMLERLVCTHPIWFLPDILRSGTVHLLQGKEIGNFIIRKSSKPNTMALTVRLPPNVGPHIEHYLIEKNDNGLLHLEGSESYFTSVPLLVAHYCQCCDELPVALTLPSVLMYASSRQELLSLALLGQDFWSSTMFSSDNPAPNFYTRRNTAPATMTIVNKPALPTPVTSPDSETEGGNGKELDSVSISKETVPTKKFVPGPPPPVPHAPKPPPRTTPVSVLTSSAMIHSKSENEASTSQEKLDFASSKSLESTEIVIRHKSNGVSKKSKSMASFLNNESTDSPGLYYKSSLADKVSDYEDIWGGSSTMSDNENPAKTFFTFKPQRPLSSIIEKHVDTDSNSSLSASLPKKEDVYTQAQLDPKVMVSNYTQTDEAATTNHKVEEKLNKNFNNEPLPRQCSLSMQDIRCHNQRQEQLAQVSSPFYAEPIDSLPNPETIQQSNDSNKRNNVNKRLVCHRHSDPNLPWFGDLIPGGAVASKKLNLNSSEDGEISISSSIENLTPNIKDNAVRTKPPIAKKVCVNKLPEEIGSIPRRNNNTGTTESIWAVDSSWEWMGQSDSEQGFPDESPLSFPLDIKFPLNFSKAHNDGSQISDTTTVEDLITIQSPELCFSDDESLASSVVGQSVYDNLELDSSTTPGGRYCSQRSDHIDDTATEFSEPWDSARWDRVLHLVSPGAKSNNARQFSDTDKSKNQQNGENSLLNKNEMNRNKVNENLSDTVPLIDCDESESASMISSQTSNEDENSFSEMPTVPMDRNKDSKNMTQQKIQSFLDTSRLPSFRVKDSFIGEPIRQYIYRLAFEKNNTFAMAIENFIQCTKESNETNPTVIMRNIRQFMNGMKNYLLKHGEGQFEELVQIEREKLKADEFLNIDVIVEGALHKLVIKPLKNYIYQLFVDSYKTKGSLQLLSDNIKFARSKTKLEIGIRPELTPPEGPALEIIRHFLLRLQQEYSPVKKLENLLAAVTTIYNSVQHRKSKQEKFHASLGADDFLPIFIYVLVHCGMISAEIEADYMWGLLQPSMLNGEGGYYLTTLSSAVDVLKKFQSSFEARNNVSQENTSVSSSSSPLASKKQDSVPNDQLNEASRSGESINSVGNSLFFLKSSEPRLPSIVDLQGFMKIMIPDELSGSIISKTLPVRPNMTTKDVCKMIALKFKISNPQDYNLFKLVNGEETQLGDAESPQKVKSDLLGTGVECGFAYKRCDAHFIWPNFGNETDLSTIPWMKDAREKHSTLNRMCNSLY